MNSQETSHSTIKSYLLVFFGLAILTGLTVFLSYAGLPHRTAIALAALIALTKCTLIATFFMHLRFEKKGFVIMIIVALFFVGVLVASLIKDIGLLS
jgi:caa(3)-type oxidase subunit IV